MHICLIYHVSSEAPLTVNLHPQGVVQSQQVNYEVLPDEEQQCCKCRTTCYLSGITCPCSPRKMVCLYHTQDLCSCRQSNRTLKWVLSNHNEWTCLAFNFTRIYHVSSESAKLTFSQYLSKSYPKRNFNLYKLNTFR